MERSIASHPRELLTSKKAENYLLRAPGEASAGKAVSMPKTKPYGCNVKY